MDRRFIRHGDGTKLKLGEHVRIILSELNANKKARPQMNTSN